MPIDPMPITKANVFAWLISGMDSALVSVS